VSHWQLIGGWLYVRCRRCYRDFLQMHCRVVFVGCSTGHVNCSCTKREANS